MGPVLELDQAVIRHAARAARGDPSGDVGPWRVEPVDYEVASPTTGGLYRIRGGDWSLFVKVVHSYRHWPLLHVMPPALRARALRRAAWRYEADVYRSNLPSVLPDGLRLAHVHSVEELGDDRLALVMEDVASAPTGWDGPRYERAARLLGRLDVVLTTAEGLPALEWRHPAERTRIFYTSRVLPVALPVLADDSTWNHPLLRDAADPELRADMTALAARIPALLDALGNLPQVVGHGDACPNNLLVPRDRPDTFVVIDWALGGVAAVGDDLGQLLLGGAHDGVLDVADLAALHDVIVGAYGTGLADEGLLVGDDVIRFGMDAGLVVRSAFTALPLDRLAEPVTSELAALVERRLELTRYLVDVGLALPPTPARWGLGRDTSRTERSLATWRA